MNVLFISQCSKNALTETRRILDQFAERRGERCWQTTITQEGLDTVRRLLRRSARKNTAVACHWIRGRNHSELLWVVGDTRQFNAEGATPTNTTTRNVLRAEDENTWHHLPLISLLAALAALLHDLGKSCDAFQNRLRAKEHRRNKYRHEWISVRLLQAFVNGGDDRAWLQRLAACADDDTDVHAFAREWLAPEHTPLCRDGLEDVGAHRNPFRTLPPLAAAIAWLVLTHHRLPCKPVSNNAPNDADGEGPEGDEAARKSPYKRFGSRPGSVNNNELPGLLAHITADWNEPCETIGGKQDEADLREHWTFGRGLPVTGPAWRRQAARYARKLLTWLEANGKAEPLHDPFIMHIARLCMMVADHYYSGLREPAQRRSPANALYANTYRDGGKTTLNQPLDTHLLGVQGHATRIVHALPDLVRSLPALHQHRALKKRSANPRFAWQDKAADLAAQVRGKAAAHGAFIVNMASTGCGKTLGNARVMNALADPATGLRCAFAIGLRTLTLQTGRVFQRDLGLDDEQLAIFVGGSASRALFEHAQRQAEAGGSASAQALYDETDSVLYEGDSRHPLLQRLTADPRAHKLLAAPLLACTVDHLTPATESLRGGGQIIPMLRLLTGDLVLDEPDDFDMGDLPALTRLVHWAGLLGSRVLLSSATLPPALVHGLFLAYHAGRTAYQRHRGARPGEPPAICCLWIDEFRQQAQDCADGDTFKRLHQSYAQKRAERLAQAEPRQRAYIAPLPGAWARINESERHAEFARLVLEQAWQLHLREGNHGTDPAGDKRYSLGLIRMANIKPLFHVARALYENGLPDTMRGQAHVHLCVYHAQYPLLLRSAIERELDALLDRHGETDPAPQRPALRAQLDAHPEPHHLFIVLGSPVTEVGRDHDYDWAVVEPSSMRSIIQLAGRVRRHRPGATSASNIALLGSNLRHYKNPNAPAFLRPGFELDGNRTFTLKTHTLETLMQQEMAAAGTSGWFVTAAPRIVMAQTLQPRSSLADLEHARMHHSMLPPRPEKAAERPVLHSADLCWHYPEPLWLTGLLPQYQRFRLDTQPKADIALLPDEDETGLSPYCIHTDTTRSGRDRYALSDTLCHPVWPRPPEFAGSVTPWLAHISMMDELTQLAQALDTDLLTCAQRFATASLPRHWNGWWWDERLGFIAKE